MVKKQPQKIQYRIIEIRKISNFENSTGDLGLKREDINQGNVQIGILVLVNEKNNQIKFDIDVTFFSMKGNDRYDLFGARTIHRFEIRNMADVFARNENNKLEIPDIFMTSMIRIAIGSVRGILAVLTTNVDYAGIYLPVLDNKVLLNSIKRIEEK